MKLSPAGTLRNVGPWMRPPGFPEGPITLADHAIGKRWYAKVRSEAGGVFLSSESRREFHAFDKSWAALGKDARDAWTYFAMREMT